MYFLIPAEKGNPFEAAAQFIYNPDLSREENMALAYTRGSRSGPFSLALSRKKRDLFRDALARYGMGLEDRQQREDGNHHFAALFKRRAERTERPRDYGPLGQAVRMTVPGRQTVEHRHHHPGRPKAAHRPGHGMKLEESLEQPNRIVRQKRSKDAEEQHEVGKPPSPAALP